MSMIRHALLALTVSAVLAFAGACGDDEPSGPATPAAATPAAATPAGTVRPEATAPSGTPVPPSGTGADVPANFFQNGSFESGRDPWFSLTTEAWGTAFSVSSDQAHSGSQSAYLELRASSDEPGTRVFGVVQELTPPQEFPEVISGYYRVQDWSRGAPKQYLQFVIIAFGVDNLPGGHVNHQIRYVLAGVPQQPLEIGNAKYILLTKEDPPTDQWVHFEVPVRQDFVEQWGDVPQGFERLRLLFEVRYDEKTTGSEANADVYYDDLFMGPSAGNPNQP